MGRKSRDKKARPTTPPQDGPHDDGVHSAQESAAQAPHRAVSARPAKHHHQPFQLLPPHAALWGLALLAVTVFSYLGALQTPFLLDDPVHITKNTVIQRPLLLSALLADPRAVVTLSLRWNYLMGGLDVAGYHALNIAAHALTGFLVFALSWATLGLMVFRDRYLRHRESLAAVAALIFLLHPIQTESVTYIIQRAEVFAAAALLASLLALLAMRDRVTPRGLAALVSACVVGAYSKPSFAVVPALLLLFDVCFLSRGSWKSFASRWPVYLVATLATLLSFSVSQSSGSLSGNTAGFEMEGITALGYLSTQFGVIVHYLRVTLWPSNLCFDCGYRGPWPVLPTFLGDSVLLPLGILTSLVAASVACWKRQPLATLAVLGSAVVLLPTSSALPLADFYVEHRMYLPIALLALALVPLTHEACTWLAKRTGAPQNVLRFGQLALAGGVVVALAGATHARNVLFSDPIALMEDSLARAPQNERVHYNLANAYKRLGRTDDAIPHYQAAIELLPNIIRSYQNLGALYMQQGKPELALDVYLAGVAAKPEVAMAHRNVANAYLRLSRGEEALAAADRSLRLDPSSPNGYRLRGDALLKMGQRSEAIAAWRDGLARVPSDTELQERLSAMGSR